ncbi:hypothetical protein, partial [Methylobacterium soli]
IDYIMSLFPGIEPERFAHALSVLKDEFEEIELLNEREERALARMLTFYSKHDIPEGTAWIDAVRVVAETGDAEALAYLNKLESPASRCHYALLEAAADACPCWRRDAGHFICDEAVPGPHTPEALVDWFQMNHPHDARAIEARFEEA